MTNEKRDVAGKDEIRISYIWAGFFLVVAVVLVLCINSLTGEVHNVRSELREIKNIMRQQVAQK